MYFQHLSSRSRGGEGLCWGCGGAGEGGRKKEVQGLKQAQGEKCEKNESLGGGGGGKGRSEGRKSLRQIP